ncbi:tellurite resistance/C4-dicarboxylate transporter family protein [Streptomyces diastaticus]
MESLTSPAGRPGARRATFGPVAGAAVMATGIVSTGCHLVGAEVVSLVLLGVGGAGWALLVGIFLQHFLGAREQWRRESRTAASLTGVAATSVLGTRVVLLGWAAAGWVLLAVAAAGWVVLLPQVVRRLGRRVPGSAYLTCVATQSLGVLGATLAPATGVAWPLPVAVVLLVAGFGLYVLVLLHFDFRQLQEGAGDHWVACGALAISALAAGKLTAASGEPLGWAEPLRSWLSAVTFVLLLAALAWYAVIAAAELRQPLRRPQAVGHRLPARDDGGGRADRRRGGRARHLRLARPPRAGPAVGGRGGLGAGGGGVGEAAGGAGVAPNAVTGGAGDGDGAEHEGERAVRRSRRRHPLERTARLPPPRPDGARVREPPGGAARTLGRGTTALTRD